jgi:8-oxo-dGTP pyrophosphatase MutT (NUDIX family)
MENNTETQNPWKVLAEKEVYDNPWITVTHSDVLNPKGKPGIYGKVSFKNLAIGVVPVDAEMNTYLVGQFRFTINEYSWEIPEGGAKLGTDPVITAQNELREETGLIAENYELLCPRLHTSNSVTNEIGYMYLATGLSQGPDEQEDTEDITVKKLPLAEAVAMVLDGRITDSISQTALLLAARKFGI